MSTTYPYGDMSQCPICNLWYNGMHYCGGSSTTYLPAAQHIYHMIDPEIHKQIQELIREIKELKDIIAKQQ